LNSRVLLSAVAFLVCAVAPAQAIPVRVSFTVTGFGMGAPTNPVVGSIDYNAASIFSDINSLTSINLTIAGHIYTVGELGFISSFAGNQQLIGGSISGVTGLAPGTNDFLIVWNENTLMPITFAYTAASTPGFFPSFTFTQFSVAAVPEPGSLALLVSGVVILGIVLRRKSRLVLERVPVSRAE